MNDPIQPLLEEGVRSGVFPAAQAVVYRFGRRAFQGVAGDARANTFFDLASLTKVMATTPVFMHLWAKGRLGPDTEVRRFFPDAPIAKAGARLSDLLYHRAGLPAFVPFFSDVVRAHPGLLDEGCPAALRAQVRAEVVARAVATEPVQRLAQAALYSDVGFILLGEILARVGDRPLDELFEAYVATPLELGAHFRRLSRGPSAKPQDVAPTGHTRPREPAPGQESLWPAFERTVPARPGEVDDDNAWVLDGVAGHAGLFGTAHDVARFGQAILGELEGDSKIAPAVLWERALNRDPKTPGSSRAFGFDTPAEPKSSGRYIGDAPPGAVGHLGFTGSSLWIDRARSLVVALCTNRTYNGRGNTQIREFRPRFHDAVVEALRL
ncbi:MAG: beta-lactamase family protein [Myxococcaceae bacterium]|nr:beta-lactamase family protein [Myxococcaceae bacterium]